MKRAITLISITTLLAAAIFSSGKIACYYSQSIENQNNIKALIVENDSKAENYKRLKKHNPDLIGWIRIPGTPIDYPVMWSPDEPEKYLSTDFDGNYSMSGLPFAAADSNISGQPEEAELSNTLIYGHHMRDGSMFAVLTEYEKHNFYEKHKTIEFDRIYDDGSYKEQEYEVFSAFKTEIGNGFEYYRYASADTEEELTKYISKVRKQSLLCADSTVEKQTELITLSTCSYHVRGKNGRFVVAAVGLK